eukprot:1972631-Prorocentrum_lima.AAC.1
MEFQGKSPMRQLLQRPGGGLGARAGDCILVQAGPVQPLLQLAAKHALWSITKQTLLNMGKELGL